MISSFLDWVGCSILSPAYLSQDLDELLFLHCNRPPKAFPQHQCTFHLEFVHLSPSCKQFCGWLQLITKTKTRQNNGSQNADKQTVHSQALPLMLVQWLACEQKIFTTLFGIDSLPFVFIKIYMSKISKASEEKKSFVFFFFLLLEVEFRALCVVDKCPTTKLNKTALFRYKFSFYSQG